MLQLVVIQFWDPPRQIPYDLDLDDPDEVPTVVLGDLPREKPEIEDAKLHYHKARNFWFLGYRWAGIDPRSNRYFEVMSEEKARAFARLAGKDLCDPALVGHPPSFDG